MWSDNVGKTKSMYKGDKLIFFVEYIEKKDYAVSIQNGVTEKVLKIINCNNLIEARLEAIGVISEHLAELQLDLRKSISSLSEEIKNRTTNTNKS